MMAFVTGLAAGLIFWRLTTNAYGNVYYAAAVRSMSQSWRAFFYVAYDPNGFISVDKPPLGLWLQVASVKLLGYSGFSLLLPEALAGVASVVILWRVARRSFGPTAAVIATLALAITPISVVASRDNILEPSLTLTLLLAAWALIRAMERASWRWLLLSAVFLGLAFNVKMLEAYLVVPAFALAYLWKGGNGYAQQPQASDAFRAAPLRRRLFQLAVAGSLMLALSFSWIIAVQLTPASQRPYVGSTTTNSEFDLAFGYNGIGKLLGSYASELFPGRHLASADTPPSTRARAALRPGAQATKPSTTEPGQRGVSPAQTGSPTAASPADLRNLPGVLRLFQPVMGSQVSWLLVLALVGTLVLWFDRADWHDQSDRHDRRAVATGAVATVGAALNEAPARLLARERGAIFWGGWLLCVGACFSFAQAISLYYVDILAPALCALVGAGAVALWRAYRRAHGWWGYALPAALALTGFEQAYLLRAAPRWEPAWLPLTPPAELPMALTRAALALAITLAAWRAVSTYRSSDHATGARSSARRAGWASAGFAALSLAMAALTPLNWTLGSLSYGNAGGWPMAGPEFARVAPREPLSVSSSLLHYLLVHRHGARYLLATVDSYIASPLMIATGLPVMAMGGFNGRDPALTPTSLDALVDSGQVRMFLISSTNLTSAQRAALLAAAHESTGLVRAGGSHTTQKLVAKATNGSPSTTPTVVHYTNDLTQWVSASCAPVPLSQWDGPRAPSQPGAWILYSCSQ
jgi:4-amino-4-deoxy-L-arabinose transferase-like glycosyltransferase